VVIEAPAHVYANAWYRKQNSFTTTSSSGAFEKNKTRKEFISYFEY
jgi:GTP cyclohydrolase I